MKTESIDLAIVGGGISGCALAYLSANYSNIKSIALFEKYDSLGSLNTKATSNSQTIHFGDIETNYTAQKAAITKRAAKMVEKYCLRHNYQNRVIFSHQKMALGVGEEEVEFMLLRYEEFSELFPNLEIWDKKRLKTLEPSVAYEDRDGTIERKDHIVGVGSQNGWTTVDYGAMSETLIENAKKANPNLEIFLNSKATKITKNGDRFDIATNSGEFSASFVVVNAGAHSLYLAHKMGYGLEFSTLPIAGSFYSTKKRLLNGKVYMVQNKKLPFAALHGDPDILLDGCTRFGPTALMLPKLERYKSGTYLDFLSSFRANSDVFYALFSLLKDREIRDYILKNLAFEIPFINTKLFVQDAKKIVPSLGVEDIEYSKGFGGVRPQVIDKKSRKLMLGEASINPKNGIIFNMTPSPGATSSLANGERDLRYIVEYLGLVFDEDRFVDDLIEEPYCPLREPIDEQKRVANRIRDEIKRQESEFYEEILDGADENREFWENPLSPWLNKRSSYKK